MSVMGFFYFTEKKYEFEFEFYIPDFTKNKAKYFFILVFFLSLES